MFGSDGRMNPWMDEDESGAAPPRNSTREERKGTRMEKKAKVVDFISIPLPNNRNPRINSIIEILLRRFSPTVHRFFSFTGDIVNFCGKTHFILSPLTMRTSVIQSEVVDGPLAFSDIPGRT